MPVTNASLFQRFFATPDAGGAVFLPAGSAAKNFLVEGRDLAKTFLPRGRSGLRPRVRARDNKALQDDGGG